ncbi:unnamed protein product [Sphagnum compactum]
MMSRDGDLPPRLTSKEEMKDVEKLLDFKNDMRKIGKAQLKHLEEKKQEVKERLAGLPYNMEDQKAEFVKVQNNMHEVEASILKVKGQQNQLQDKLHPDWWTSWGFGELDEELIKLAKQMTLAKARDDKMLKVKEVVTSGQYLSPKGMPFTLTGLIKQNGVHMFLDFHMP